MSVAGTWKLTMDTPFGVQTPLLAIRQEGGAHSGTLTGATGEATLEELKVEGSTVSFTAEAKTPMGSFDVSYRATVDGDTMNGTFKTMMGITPFTGARQ
jgi:hypothetical protein